MPQGHCSATSATESHLCRNGTPEAASILDRTYPRDRPLRASGVHSGIYWVVLYPRRGEKVSSRVATVAPKRSPTRQRLAEELGIDELVDSIFG